jgi:peptide/nickel transport system substrate-binding protein
MGEVANSDRIRPMSPLMRGAAAAALIALLSVGGCRRASQEPVEYHDPHPLPEEPYVVQMPTPGRHGGRFVTATISSPRTFNAMMSNEASSGDITERSFARLTDFDNATQASIPGLAKAWEVAADGMTWTYQLRRGARFSDGQPITSADVLFSFEVALDPELHPVSQDGLVMNGRRPEISAPDPYTFVITTPAVNAGLVHSAASVPIMPKHVLEPAFRNGTFASAYNVSTPPDQIVTSGPWRIAQYVPNERTVLARNPYWYGVDSENRRLPYLNEVIFLVVPDVDAADLKFRAGELHGLDDVKPENYQWYEENQQKGNYTLYDLGPDLNTNYFWFNLNKVQKPSGGRRVGDSYADPVKHSWFSNPVFRRAVSLAIDRDAMIPSVFFGEGLKNWASATPANKVWHSPDVVRYDYNPDEARKLLGSLGWKDANGDGIVEDARGNPVTFSLKTNSSNTMRIAMMNFIKEDLAKVGINVITSPVDFNTLITNLRSDFQYDAILLGMASGIPPDPIMAVNFWRSSGLTHPWFIAQAKPETPEEARIDRLMDTIVSSHDLEARLAAYREAENILNEMSWLIWLPIRNQKMPISNRFGNLEPSILRHRILWNSYKMYVKAHEN